MKNKCDVDLTPPVCVYHVILYNFCSLHAVTSSV